MDSSLFMLKYTNSDRNSDFWSDRAKVRLCCKRTVVKIF